MKEVDLIIKNGIILTQDDEDRVFYSGCIAVQSGTIEGVGSHDDILKHYRGKKVIDASRKAVLPGFVNTHFHFTQNFLKGTRDDLNLLEWIDRVSFPRIKITIDNYRKGNAEIHKLAALHAGIDLLSSGITCTANMEWGMTPELSRSYELLGMRIINILTMTDVDSWTPKEAIIEENEVFDLAEKLIETFDRSKGKIDFAYGIACPNSATEKMISRTRREASKRKVGLYIHLAETKYEFDKFLKTKNATPTKYLDDLGFWKDDVCAVHSIWLNPEDIEILAQHNVGISHNPKCNMKIASGAAPIADMKKQGLHIGIGIDSCAVSDNTDFFEAMRTMIFLQRVTTMNPTALLGKDALKIATIEGAKSIGKGDEIGSLEKGKKADILLINLTDVNTRPYNDLVNNLVFAANSANIDTVLVEGEVLMHKGDFTRFNKESILDEVENRVAEIYRDAGVELPRFFSINDL